MTVVALGLFAMLMCHVFDLVKLYVKYPDYKKWEGIYIKSGRDGFHQVLNIIHDKGGDYYTDQIMYEHLLFGWLVYKSDSSMKIGWWNFVYKDGTDATEEVNRRLNEERH